MKKPTKDEARQMCTSKRKYASEGAALEAAAILGIERSRRAYRCALCGKWHLTSK